jgi:outer membrane lipoprotein carrier protein
MKYIPWILILSIFLFSLTPQDVAMRTEKKLFSLSSIKADFEQIYYSVSVTTPLREKGEFTFKKPDLMKWEYQEPEEKVFLYKKGNFLFYIPEDNQLIKSSLAEENHESEILNLLSGKKILQDHYLIEFSPFPTENAHAVQLKLIPREEDEYSFILLEIDEKSWLIRKAIFLDWVGNKTEFRFNRIKTNVRVPQSFFELKVPPDVEIIETLKKP